VREPVNCVLTKTRTHWSGVLSRLRWLDRREPSRHLRSVSTLPGRGPLGGPRGWDAPSVRPDVDAAIQRSFLGILPANVADRVTAQGELVDYPAGATFYREGDPPRATLVVSGLIRVYLASPEGRQVTVRYARSGEVLGIPLVVGGPLDVGAQTLVPSSLFNLDARALVEIARVEASVAF